MTTAGARSAPRQLAPACTTHFSAVDRDGNMAAVTQTLLSSFGSHFVCPQTGITMNNGIMWFDPKPGTPNSLAPGKRCLTNYTPVLAQAADGRRVSVGASGGRRILPAVTQLLSFVMDYGMDLDAAIHQPRIDTSEGAIVVGDIAAADGGARRSAHAFRLRGGADPDPADEIRLPEPRAARRHHQQRRHRAVPAMERGGRGDLKEIAMRKVWIEAARVERRASAEQAAPAEIRQALAALASTQIRKASVSPYDSSDSKGISRK